MNGVDCVLHSIFEGVIQYINMVSYEICSLDVFGAQIVTLYKKLRYFLDASVCSIFPY